MNSAYVLTDYEGNYIYGVFNCYASDIEGITEKIREVKAASDTWTVEDIVEAVEKEFSVTYFDNVTTYNV